MGIREKSDRSQWRTEWFLFLLAYVFVIPRDCRPPTHLPTSSICNGRGLFASELYGITARYAHIYVCFAASILYWILRDIFVALLTHKHTHIYVQCIFLLHEGTAGRHGTTHDITARTLNRIYSACQANLLWTCYNSGLDSMLYAFKPINV